MEIRAYTEADIPAMTEIWNEIVREGVAFPETEEFSLEEAAAFFASQTHCGVAVENGQVIGFYALHQNNKGRCGHIANAANAVGSSARGKGVGRPLVTDSLEQARRAGFTIMQYNAVVESNAAARHLYESLGFKQLGTIPNGFKLPDGSYADICPYYYVL